MKTHVAGQKGLLYFGTWCILRIPHASYCIDYLNKTHSHTEKDMRALPDLWAVTPVLDAVQRKLSLTAQKLCLTSVTPEVTGHKSVLLVWCFLQNGSGYFVDEIGVKHLGCVLKTFDWCCSSQTVKQQILPRLETRQTASWRTRTGEFIGCSYIIPRTAQSLKSELKNCWWKQLPFKLPLKYR